MEQVLDEFGRRSRDFQALDAGRSKFTELREVVAKLKKAEEDCEVEVLMKSYYQQQIQNLEKQVKAAEKRSFVVVVIDADGDPYMFHPTLLEQGGEFAADELQKKVREYLRTFPEDSDDFVIIVKAFAGLDKLVSTLTANGRIRSESQLRHFVANFNKRSTFFDFIDVGYGKERADQKVRVERDNKFSFCVLRSEIEQCTISTFEEVQD
ncbi:hypothetical protein LTR84_004036 [Exophiala bonariae]|uniref:DUF7923 domain-containing protein n=1 Tax=Exophiala bonariae TaxID=1690606 RepID=A0AAV9N565_9EURO|nr:hypothetical protein LTR84_004036 [Exophiala bonariae]